MCKSQITEMFGNNKTLFSNKGLDSNKLRLKYKRQLIKRKTVILINKFFVNITRSRYKKG